MSDIQWTSSEDEGKKIAGLAGSLGKSQEEKKEAGVDLLQGLFGGLGKKKDSSTPD